MFRVLEIYNFASMLNFFNPAIIKAFSMVQVNNKKKSVF